MLKLLGLLEEHIKLLDTAVSELPGKQSSSISQIIFQSAQSRHHEALRHHLRNGHHRVSSTPVDYCHCSVDAAFHMKPLANALPASSLVTRFPRRMRSPSFPSPASPSQLFLASPSLPCPASPSPLCPLSPSRPCLAFPSLLHLATPSRAPVSLSRASRQNLSPSRSSTEPQNLLYLV